MSSGPPGPGIWVQSKPGEGPVGFVRWEGGGSEPKAVLSAIEPVLEPEEVSFLFFSLLNPTLVHRGDARWRWALPSTE